MTSTTNGNVSTTTTNGKRLRQEVSALLSDAREHLPKEFHVRLRKVSEAFFEHRKEVGRLQQRLSDAERRVEELRKTAANQDRQSASVEAELESQIERVKRLTSDIAGKQSELDQAAERFSTDIAQQQQTQFTIRTAIDDLILRLGEAAMGEHNYEVSVADESSRVASLLTRGDLSKDQLDRFVKRAVGYFISQVVPEDCVYQWHPLGLIALVHRDQENPQLLVVKVESISDENSGDGQGDTGTLNDWWWLALNGASCAASPVAMPPNLNVNPTPQQLVGFRTRQEQLSAQRLMLNAPMSKVRRYMEATVPAKVAQGEMFYIRPDKPEPAPKGPTMWVSGSTTATDEDASTRKESTSEQPMAEQ